MITAKEVLSEFKKMDYDDKWGKFVNFEDLLGKTIVDIHGAERNSEFIAIVCDDGSKYVMYHERDCCEHVWVEDVCGSIERIVDRPLLKAEESKKHEEGEWGDSTTWTFYHIATVKGYVTIRWCGTSNGYYSESVSIIKL